MKRETIAVWVDNGKDKLYFKVPSNWLWKVLKEWALEDSKDVDNDVETYIKGRTESLYENLDDLHFASEIFELAVSNNIIVDSKEVTASK